MFLIKTDKWFWAAFLTALAFLAITFVLASLRYQGHNAGYFDMGIADNIVWRLAFKGDLSAIFQGHLRPLFLLIAPVYRLVPRAETLLFVSSAAVAGTGLGLFALARQKLTPAGAFALSVLFFAHPASWFLAIGDFHIDVFYMLFALGAVMALEKQRPWQFMVWALAMCLVKEPLALGAVVLGLVAATNPRMRWPGLGVAGLGLAYFLVVSFSVVPAFNASGAYTRFFGPPWIDADKLVYWLFLLMPLGGFALLRPKELAPGLVHPGLVIFANFPGYYGVHSHYAAGFLVFGFWALMEFFARVNWKKVFPIAGAGAMFAQVFWGPTPFGLMWWRDSGPFNRWIYTVQDRDRQLDQEMRQYLPEDKAASVQINLITGNVTHRKRLWPFPFGLDSAQFAVIDTSTGRWVGMRKDPEAYSKAVQGILQDSAWFKLFDDEKGLLIFKRKAVQ